MKTVAAGIRLLLTCLLGLAPLTAASQTFNVLWYTYADPSSRYVLMIQKLADTVHHLPQSGGVRWKLTFYGPASPVPAFKNYNVLVIHSGEAFHSGKYYPYLGTADPARATVRPDYSGILKNRSAIEAARGERTFITGADADIHAINGDTGQAPKHQTRKAHSRCNPPIIGEYCWDGALGHLVNAVNWAASGRGLGIVSLVAAEFPGSRWWLEPESFLRNELMGHVTIWGEGGKQRENEPVIPPAAQGYPLNGGLTSLGLSNWNNSFHAGFSHSIPGYTTVVDSRLYPGTAVAIATAKFANGGTRGPQAPAAETVPAKRK